MEDLNSTPEVKKSFINFNPKDNPVAFIAFLFFAFLAFGAISAYLLNTNTQRNQENGKQEEKTAFKPLADNTLVYGYWTENASQINGLNLNTGDIKEIASLPSGIKKVIVISPKSVIYINQTDVRDHGKEIVVYDIVEKRTISIINSNKGYGIDDYVISPNKKYIALWEVSIPDGKSLSSGRSIVSVSDISNPDVKSIIYEENLPDTEVAHYPVAITDKGEVFMDTFEPNAGAGWANGMSSALLNGSPSAILSMPSGSYGTKPELSLDGRFLVFGGYDGSRGVGSISVGNSEGFRQAILSPNHIGLLDTETKERTKIEGFSNQNIYPRVSWDALSGNINLLQISKDSSLTGQYSYNLSTRNSDKIDDVAEGETADTYSIISSLSSNKYLAGQQDISSTALGNLGKAYAQSYTSLAIFDASNKKLSSLPIKNGFVQYIGLLPSSYLVSSLQTVDTIGNKDGKKRNSVDQLQLQTFVIKTELEPVRSMQQSEVYSEPGQQEPPKDLPQCRDLAVAQCNQMYGEDISGDEAWGALYGGDRSGTGSSNYDSCFETTVYSGGTLGECADSPLYLYGDLGKNVSVEIGTQVSNSNAPYLKNYQGTLTGDGGISINGTRYKSLEYDYVPAIRRLPKLDYGKTVKASEVGSVISEYGQKLGLNKKEIEDTVGKLEGELDSPLAFVSFYDEKTSKAILPISFDPKPDVYRNIVFYLKPVSDPIIAKAPIFEKYPERQGFTAVEVSYIID